MGLNYKALFSSPFTDLKIKTTARDKGHFIMIKGSKQEDITIVNIYTPNIGALQCLRQILTDIKGEIGSNIIIMCVCVSSSVVSNSL